MLNTSESCMINGTQPHQVGLAGAQSREAAPLQAMLHVETIPWQHLVRGEDASSCSGRDLQARSRQLTFPRFLGTTTGT